MNPARLQLFVKLKKHVREAIITIQDLFLSLHKNYDEFRSHRQPVICGRDFAISSSFFLLSFSLHAPPSSVDKLHFSLCLSLSYRRYRTPQSRFAGRISARNNSTKSHGRFAFLAPMVPSTAPTFWISDARGDPHARTQSTRHANRWFWVMRALIYDRSRLLHRPRTCPAERACNRCYARS